MKTPREKELEQQLDMFKSWMKRKGSHAICGGSVWDAICDDYPYLQEPVLDVTDRDTLLTLASHVFKAERLVVDARRRVVAPHLGPQLHASRVLAEARGDFASVLGCVGREAMEASLDVFRDSEECVATGRLCYGGS